MNRGPWLFKDDWLALAPFDPTFNAQDHTFNTMNVWVRIHDIPSVLMDSDSMAIQSGSSLSSLIGNVTKTDTRRIDVATCSTVKLSLETKLQYNYWLRYLPPTIPFGSSRPQGLIHYHATNIPANPPTPISSLYLLLFITSSIYFLDFPDLVFYDKSTRLANLGKETIEESVHSSDEASAANDANLAPNLPDQLDDFLNEEDFSATLDVLDPTH
ncbi:hypothetical protein V6N13_130543 [Hibiscus sabdariffa]|uniref:Uncharacterized protein n=2 Tax=Hibiscus sabdariffa TaxID=183260 RepID=A0ABR2A6M2_9ROSI